jgi:hypothetical protein
MSLKRQLIIGLVFSAASAILLILLLRGEQDKLLIVIGITMVGLFSACAGSCLVNLLYWWKEL